MTREEAEREFLRALADVMQYASARGIDIGVDHTYERNRFPVARQMWTLSRKGFVRFFANCHVVSCTVQVQDDRKRRKA